MFLCRGWIDYIGRKGWLSVVVDASQPCHRIISSTGFIGGFMGDWEKVPSGLNVEKKRKLLAEEGVLFDDKGKLADQSAWWDGFVVPAVVKEEMKKLE